MGLYDPDREDRGGAARTAGFRDPPVKKRTSGINLVTALVGALLLPPALGAAEKHGGLAAPPHPVGRMVFQSARYVAGPHQFKIHEQLFDLSDDEHMLQAAQELSGLIARSDRQQAELKALRKANPTDLWLKNHEPDVLLGQPTITKSEQFALTEVKERIEFARAQKNAELHSEAIAAAVEIGNAVNNTSKPAAPRYIEVLALPISGPYFYHKYLGNNVEIGKTPASNVAVMNDGGTGNPTSSSLWRDENIRSKNTYVGFGRTAIPWVVKNDVYLTYKEPKTSSGAEPGFKTKFGDQEVKIKFRETHSAAIAARLYHAVGFNVEAEDYRPGVKVLYDRLAFTQFNMNQKLNITLGFLGIPVLKKNLHKTHDPFEFLGAKLKNGQLLTGSALKTFLFRDASKPHPEMIPGNFKPEAEAQVAYLQTTPVNLQVTDKSFKGMGTFEYGELGHDRMREFRGSALMAAWVGNFDVRRDNTKLRVADRGPAGRPELQYEVSDVGGTFIASVGIGSKYESWDKFPWAFTRSSAKDGKPFKPGSFKVAKTFKVATPTKAFTSVTEDDARWMGRKIGALSEEQIKGAVIGGGLDSATAMLLTEKLVSRRDQMIRDLGLEQEVGLLRPHGENTSVKYDPRAVNVKLGYDPDSRKDGAAKVKLPDGSVEAAPVTGVKIINGHIWDPEAIRQARSS